VRQQPCSNQLNDLNGSLDICPQKKCEPPLLKTQTTKKKQVVEVLLASPLRPSPPRRCPPHAAMSNHFVPICPSYFAALDKQKKDMVTKLSGQVRTLPKPDLI